MKQPLERFTDMATHSYSLLPPFLLAASMAVGAPHAVEQVGTLERGGIKIERLRFDGPEYGGAQPRVYAIYAAPDGPGPYPAVLQVHGGGQTCYPENVLYFVGLGYACLSFDWTGPRGSRPRDEVTHWPQDLTGQYFEVPGKGTTSSIIHQASEAGIAAIDVLAAREEVDPERIAVQGVSWGGLIAFNIAARDDRVAALLPVYGIGGVAKAWNQMGIGLRNRGKGFAEQWTEAFDPLSFPDSITCPVFFASGTNDFFGQLSHAEERLDALSAPVWRSYGPNRMHSLDSGTVRAGERWLDSLMRPETALPPPPGLLVGIAANGSLAVRIEAPFHAREVHVDYTRGTQHDLTGAWLTEKAREDGDGGFLAVVPLVDALQPVELIGQVVLDDGAMFSTARWAGLPARDLPGARGTLPVSDTISDWGAPDGGWFVHRGTDFFHAKAPVPTLDARQIDGRRALQLTGPEGGAVTIGTRLVTDAARSRGNAQRLEVWFHDVESLQFRTNWFLRLPSASEHFADLEGGRGWQRHLINPGDLMPFGGDAGADDGKRLASWNEVYSFHLSSVKIP